MNSRNWKIHSIRVNLHSRASRHSFNEQITLHINEFRIVLTLPYPIDMRQMIKLKRHNSKHFNAISLFKERLEIVIQGGGQGCI